MIKIIENLNTRIICKRCHEADISARTCIARQKLAARGNQTQLGYDPECLVCETGIFVAESLKVKITRKPLKVTTCRKCGKELPVMTFKHSGEDLYTKTTCLECEKKIRKAYYRHEKEKEDLRY